MAAVILDGLVLNLIFELCSYIRIFATLLEMELFQKGEIPRDFPSELGASFPVRGRFVRCQPTIPI
jgi:hypothetical protein